MGMYTEIYINVDLISETPSEIINTLKAMCGEEQYNYLLKSHPERWNRLFLNGSFYTPQTNCQMLTYNDISKQYSLLGKGDIKNYETEIEQFFEWINPFIEYDEGTFIGYMRYEEDSDPLLLYKN